MPFIKSGDSADYLKTSKKRFWSWMFIPDFHRLKPYKGPYLFVAGSSLNFTPRGCSSCATSKALLARCAKDSSVPVRPLSQMTSELQGSERGKPKITSSPNLVIPHSFPWQITMLLIGEASIFMGHFPWLC